MKERRYVSLKGGAGIKDRRKTEYDKQKETTTLA